MSPVALAAATALAAAGVAGCGAGQPPAPTPRQAAEARPERPGSGPGEIRVPALRAGRFSLDVPEPLALRSAPGGRVIGRVTPTTRFGTRTALPVVERRGAWLGVLSEVTTDGRPGWVPVAGAVLRRQPYALRVDRSARTLVVLRSGAEIRSFPIAVGAPGSPTPLGRSGVTDTLLYPTGSGPYGCCAVALTSRQTRLPVGWRGGTQIALHGTADERDIGRAITPGCLRARNADLRWVARNVPAGALVTVVR